MKRLLLFSVFLITMISCKKDLSPERITAPPVANNVEHLRYDLTGTFDFDVYSECAGENIRLHVDLFISSNDVIRENGTHSGSREYYKNVTAIGSTTGTEYNLVGQTTRVSNATTSGTFTKAVGHFTLKTPGNGNDWSWSLSIHTVADENGVLTLDHYESLYFCK